MRTTNGGEVSGFITSQGGTYPLDVWNEDGTFNVGIAGFRVAGVRFDPEPEVPEVALVESTMEGAPEADVAALDDTTDVQPAVDPTVNLDAITGGEWFTPPADENMTPAGAMAKLDANLAALRTLRTLQREGRLATPEEQGILSRWAGWGGLPGVFDMSKSEYASRRDELLTLLNTKEWNEGRRNTLNAHYTDPRVVSAVWTAMRNLGFDGGRVLEPGSGSGTFIGLAPLNAEMVGVELDSTTAAISKYLYPGAQIRNESFADTNVPDGAFDATVGNVPFGNFALVDNQHNPGRQHNIHNHFILKSMNLTRPGALVAVLSSRYTLDGNDAANRRAREQMYAQADLVGAVRLPNGSHARASETDVIEDVLIFRKRLPGEEPGDDTWLKATPRDLGPPEAANPDLNQPLPVSDYFTANPGNVLGTIGSRIGQFGPEVAVTGDRDFPDLAPTLARITAEGNQAGLTAAPRDPDVALPTLLSSGTGRYEGNISVDADGNFTQALNGAANPFDVPVKQQPELRALLGLRDTLRDLLSAEAASGEDTDQISLLRQSLNAQYDNYLTTYGPINRYKFNKAGSRVRPRQGRFRSDPLAASVRALETYDPTGDETWPEGYRGTPRKSAIFTQRAVAPRVIATTADNPVDALTLSMDAYAEVNLPAIAKMLGTDETGAREQLGTLVFEVPGDPAGDMQAMVTSDALAMAGMSNAVQTSGPALPAADVREQPGQLVPAAQYLSGNVRRKLAVAQAAAEADPAFKANVEALKAVIPDDLGPAEIDGRLGAPWIPADVVEEFVRSTLRISPYESRKSRQARVRTSGGGIWLVEAPRDSNIATEEYGIDRRGGRFGELVQTLLEQRPVRITMPDPNDPDGKKRVTDLDATLAAQAKAELIQERFGEWLWEDPERARGLQTRYNEQFNAIALRTYDGSGRSLVGASEEWQEKVLPHVKNAVERIVNEPTALLAHVVGAGKTAEMVMGSQELRRLGLARKPAIVVPNHMLEQFTREYLEIYPNAKILAAGTDDLQGDNRREFVGRAAVGDWDAVILTQGAFAAIPMGKDQMQSYIDRETAIMRAQLEAANAAAEGDTTQKRTVKKMENALISFENRLKDKLSKVKDIGVSFEQTGIDYLMVDEAHMYSNLMTNSAITGAGVAGSDKATDLHMKMEYLRANTKSGRVATFATGTPIRNTVTQTYAMQRFLRPDLLTEAGIHSFDQWAATFGEVVEEMELKPEGTGFRSTTRFAKFRNVPELLRMFHTFADVKMREDLNLETPKIAGGGAQTIAVPRTSALAAYIKDLGDRAEAVRAGDVAPEDDNMLKISTDGRKAALSMALVKVGTDDRGNPVMGTHEPGKIEEAASRIGAIYEQNKDRVYGDDPNPGALQIVFLDMGTPKGARLTAGEREDSGEVSTSVDDTEDTVDWDGYARLKAELVEKYNLPAEQVRFIHEAKNDAEKAEMFAAAKNGRISVLVGSSEKMGVGTNMQRRAVALHHLDAPWRPADVEQREGRIDRQGNLNPEVQILRYVTEGSFDAYMWQTLERKAKFINQIMKGTLDVREIEDVGDTAMSYAEVKALATGNPDLLEMAKADTRFAKLSRMQRNHNRAQTNLVAEVTRLTRVQEQAAAEAAAIQDLIERRTLVRGEAHDVSVGDVDYTLGGPKTQRAAAETALNAATAGVRTNTRYLYYEKDPTTVATVGGFRVTARELTGYEEDRMVRLQLEGFPGVWRNYTLSDLESGVAGRFFTVAENAINGLETDAGRVLDRANDAAEDLVRVQARIGLPFTHAEELAAIGAKAERLAAKIQRDSDRAEGREVEFDPRIDTDEFDHPLVRGSAAPVAAVVPEVVPARIEVAASTLTVGARVEFVQAEVSGTVAVGTIIKARQVGDFVFVTIRGDDGKEYVRAYDTDTAVTKVGDPATAVTGVKGYTPRVLTLAVIDGRVVVQGKRFSSRWKDSEHPRDRLGRFIETGAEVRIWGGRVGKIVGMAGNGRVKVERDDGAVVTVDSGNVTVTKKPDGEVVAPADGGPEPTDTPTVQTPDGGFEEETPEAGGPSKRTEKAPEATPEGAVAVFESEDGAVAWLDTSTGEPVGYLQSVRGNAATTVRFSNAAQWAESVDNQGMTGRDGGESPDDALGDAAATVPEAADVGTPEVEAPDDAPETAGSDGVDAVLAGVGNTGTPDGAGTPEDPIDVAGDLDKAVQLLAEGKHVRLNRVDEVGTLLDKLAENAKAMEAAGEKAPVLNLCQVSVPGTNLFCQQSQGLPRVEMPQLSGTPEPGSVADNMERNKRGRVDITGPFLDRLEAAGIAVTEETVPASSLKATQNELGGVAVGSMMQAMRDGTMSDAPVFITSDNYVLDGHHRWAAKVGVDAGDNDLGDVTMPVRRIDMEIGEALAYARGFAADQGIRSVANGQAATVTTRPGAVTPTTGARITANVDALVEAMGKVALDADDDTNLPGDLERMADEYDAALAGTDVKVKARAQLALTEMLAEVNNLLDTGGEEPERAAALGEYSAVAAVLDANIARLYPRAGAGGTEPGLDAPTVDAGTVKDMFSNARVPDLTGKGGSAAAYLVKGSDGQWRFTVERQAMHDAIMDSILEGVPVSDDPKYNFFGGGPASGKGGITRMFPHLKEGAAYINADEIKAVLPEMGQRVRAADPSAAGFTHEESSYLAKQIQAEGFARKVNVTLDGTGDSSEKAVRKKIAAARKAGYKVDAYYVSVPIEVATERAIKRAETGVGADRGRYVAPSVIRDAHVEVSKILPKVADDFDSLVVFDTNVPWGTPPHLMARKDPGERFKIMMEGNWQEFLDKAAGFEG